MRLKEYFNNVIAPIMNKSINEYPTKVIEYQLKNSTYKNIEFQIHEKDGE